MTRFLRGLSAILVCSIVMSTIGCAEDNEAFIRAQAEANKFSDKTANIPGFKTNSQAAYHKRQREMQATAFSKASGYPGPGQKSR